MLQGNDRAIAVS